MGLPFLKMHGLGNDFVVVDNRKGGARVTPELAKTVGDRHRGVGFDQLAEILPSDQATIRLVFWNSDGSEAGACGNATRCVARLLLQETGKDAVSIQTRRGILYAREAGNGMTSVNMGQPQLLWNEVPLSEVIDTLALPLAGEPSAVGMGNPHAVFFVKDAEAEDIAGRGRVIEHDPLFPEATNVEFASLLGPDRLRMRVWERGTGITLACGSGACATAVAAHRRGLTGRNVEVVLDGGSLFIDWRDDGVWMTGPTALVFQGELSDSMLGVAAPADLALEASL